MRFYLFTTNAELAGQAREAGIDGLVVDWERRGKAARQKDYDFEINRQGVREVRRVAKSGLSVLVRINPVGSKTSDELRRAIDAGAGEIMLPMARNAAEVERFLALADGRVKTVVQIETQDLVEDLKTMGELPWTRAYIGLNDLQISRGRRGSIWQGVADGTVEHIFGTLAGREIGFGGITVAEGGHPLPFKMLFGEMIRLGCAMSFLRRTFHKEIAGRDLKEEIAAIRKLEKSLEERSAQKVAADRRAFSRLLGELTA